MSLPAQFRNFLPHALLVAPLCLAFLWGVTLWRQADQFRLGDAAAARGDAMGALAGYEAAIHMYTPGSGRVEAAAQRIWQLAQQLEASGDPERALVAYRGLRSSFYAIHGLNRPGTEWIARCDERIAKLTGRPRSDS